MTRSQKTELVPLDKDINKTIRLLKKGKKAESSSVGLGQVIDTEVVAHTCDNSSHIGSSFIVDRHLVMDPVPPPEGIPPPNEAPFIELHNNIDRNNGERRTIKDLTSSTDIIDPFLSCPEFNINFELKGPLLSHLPKFNGLPSEDPNRHLRNMYIVCNSMKPMGVDLNEMCRQVFHFTLENKAKEWFLMLPHHNPNALASWDTLKSAFLEKYFPSSKITSLTKEIFGAKQGLHESFYEYWCRFQELLAKCPHHQIPEARLVQYFHSGLLPQDRKSLDSTSGGTIQLLTHEEAWALI